MASPVCEGEPQFSGHPGQSWRFYHRLPVLACRCGPSAMHSTDPPACALGYHVLWERLQAGVRLPELSRRDLHGEL